MAEATNEQVQAYVDERVRPRCQQLRDVVTLINNDKSLIDDVYENLTTSPNWTDERSDAPPHLLEPNDVLAWNTFITGVQKLVAGTFANVTEANSFAAQWAIILKGCVN